MKTKSMRITIKALIAFSIFFVFLSFFQSCTKGTESNSPDVSHLMEEADIIRFEQELFALDTLNIDEDLHRLRSAYPLFSKVYFSNILGLNAEDDYDYYVDQVLGFIQDDRILDIKSQSDFLFKDMNAIVESYEQSCAFMAYYFPGFVMPKLYTFLSEYTIQLFLFNVNENTDGIGIGLDMFFGEEYPYATIIPNNPAFSSYLTRTYTKEHMVKKIMEVILTDIMPDVRKDRLIDIMIWNGKKLFILDQILPETSDSIIMEYTAEQLKWCEENELQMWAYFFDEALFYETDINRINKFLYPSPHSPGMPDAAPGRTANYLGWKIVETYMKRFPETSFSELLAIEDAQALLEQSKYKPKRK